MIKVKDTKTHKTNTIVKHNLPYIALVADAELVLVEYMTAALPNCIIDATNVCIEGKCYKPILISRTEKIEVGDWIYNELSIGSITKASQSTIEGIERDNIKGYVNHLFKILALPEHFSPQQLQDIVDGKLKEGKCLVECERYSNSYATVIDEAAKDSHKHEIRIKLTPHIAIYNVEEKMYTRLEVRIILHKFNNPRSNEDVFKLNTWFDKNIK